jgi:hypothetical protein
VDLLLCRPGFLKGLSAESHHWLYEYFGEVKIIVDGHLGSTSFLYGKEKN